MKYSEKVMDHFMNPRNVGEIEDADGIGTVGNPVCGDLMSFYIKVEDDRLKDVKFKTFGCGAAIAVSSMVSEMAIGKRLEEAKKITNKSVAEQLDGLPKNKMHCSNLGADALHEAIEDYEKKIKEGKEPEEHKKIEISKEECKCPYCEELLKEKQDFCRACSVEFARCDDCGGITNKKDDECVHCGASLN